MEQGVTILIAVGEDIIARNILQTDFWPRFKEAAVRHEWRIVFAVSPKSKARVEAFAGADVDCVVYECTRAGRLESLIMTLARSGIDTHTNLWSKMRSYLRGDSSFVATWTKRVLTALFGRSAVYKKLLRKLIGTLPSDRAAAALFDTVQPDVCIPLSLGHFDFDVPLAREARKRKIPILGMVRSWDNLSSHGLLRIVPDAFFLQNRFLKEMGEAHQAIDRSRTKMHIVGLPHYDRYATMTEAPIPREEWCRILGLDPHKKVILYGAMGEYLFTTEGMMPKVLNAVVAEAGLSQAVQVLFRSHPRFVPKTEGLNLPNIVMHIPDAYTDTESGYDNESILVSSIMHAEFVVTGASTMAIDAVMLKRQPVCIGFDPTPVSYWESVERFYDCYTHYEAFIAVSGTPIARSALELMHEMKRFIESPAYDAEGRARTVDLLAAPFDGRAGERLAALMEEEIIRVSHGRQH